MTAPFTTSDRLFDYGGPQPYNAQPVCTPFADIHKELEWQKTQHALGRPVDIAALFAVVERANDEAQQAILDATDDHEEEMRAVEIGRQAMVKAINDADEALNEVRTVFAEQILGKLNQIDRNVVAKLKKMDAIQKRLKGSL